MSNRRLREKLQKSQRENEKSQRENEKSQREIEELKQKLKNSIDQSRVFKMIQAGYEKEEGEGSFLSQIENEYNHRKEKKENKAKVAKILNDTKDHGGKRKLKKSKPVFKNDDFLVLQRPIVRHTIKMKEEQLGKVEKMLRYHEYQVDEIKDICGEMQKTYLGCYETGVFKELFDKLRSVVDVKDKPPMCWRRCFRDDE